MSVRGRGRFQSDAADRRAIREELRRNLLVEAAAGTGKTTSLVDRMLALVAEGEATADRICAVTFTVKAAAQLKERFQVALEGSLAAERDAVKRDRLAAALDGIDRCFIGTIHSFCARLLRERPVEGGVDPEFVELDETEDLLLRQEAWERYKQSLFLESSPLLSELSRYGMPINLLEEAYQCLASNPDVEPAVADRLPEPEFERERDLVLAFLERAGKEIPPRDPEARSDSLQRKLRSALRLKEIRDLRRPAELVSLFERLQGSGKVVQKLWPNAAIAVRLRDDYDALVRDVVSPALGRWREFLYPLAIEAVRPAVTVFRRLRRERGVLDFGDLLLLARDLLRDHAEARRDFQRRFTPVLVDEFQDTDPIQAEVLLYLTGEDIEEKNWRRLVPAAGSLFVVGDPKQSIYRFRRADIETYERVKERICASGGRVLKLTTNFRSSPEVCDWINDFFTNVFPAEASREQAADAPLVADRPNAGGFSGVVRLQVPATAGRSREDVARADAVRIASWIQSALDAKMEIAREGSRSAMPGDFLILFRYKKSMNTYARELELRGIPYEIAGGGAFSESEDLRDLLPILECIADPDDPISLVASLRGPFFGVDDDALYRHRCEGGRFHMFAPPPAAADPRILRAVEMLRDAYELSKRLPPAAALGRIAAKLGAIAYGGSLELGGTRAGNLLKAVSIARDLSASGESFASIVRHLRRLTEKSETEEMSTSPGAVRAVRLLTLHRAKGLEAPVVFLADPGGEWDAPIDWCVGRDTEPPQAWLRVLRQRRDEIARPAGWCDREANEKRFGQAENARLLYVAATRAADLLVVSAGPNETKSPWARLAEAAVRPLPDLPSRRVAAAILPAPDLSTQLRAFRERVESRREAAARATYRIEPVTKLVHATDGTAPFRARTGRGMSWGRVIHRLLEGAMKDPGIDVRLFAGNVLADEERSALEVDEAVHLVEAVRASPLWRRALVAARRLTEVPFALTAESGDLGIPAGGPDRTLLQGAIDLAFEEDSGWVLVDYKSDTIVGNLEELVAFYSPQIGLYRRYWEKLTGRPTKAGLYFVSTGQEIWPTDA
ncbi:MAG TPA: UvrD-helicase domain-containing protein [Thermoanaerobaculia bacterium]|nr:UvrD-helicase domain-containing protein [Thermoanaerobaculia bacterium]